MVVLRGETSARCLEVLMIYRMQEVLGDESLGLQI